MIGANTCIRFRRMAAPNEQHIVFTQSKARYVFQIIDLAEMVRNSFMLPNITDIDTVVWIVAIVLF